MSINIKILLKFVLVLATTEPRLVVDHKIITPIRQVARSKGIILWDYEGLWGLLTVDHVAEVVRRYDELEKAAKQYPQTTLIKTALTFQHVTPVSATVAKAIRG